MKAIIIGSGISGLTAAATLAQKGLPDAARHDKRRLAILDLLVAGEMGR